MYSSGSLEISKDTSSTELDPPRTGRHYGHPCSQAEGFFTSWVTKRMVFFSSSHILNSSTCISFRVCASRARRARPSRSPPDRKRVFAQWPPAAASPRTIRGGICSRTPPDEPISGNASQSRSSLSCSSSSPPGQRLYFGGQKARGRGNSAGKQFRQTDRVSRRPFHLF